MGVRQWWDLRVAKRGRTRSRSALCGVLAFDQNLGLWPALLGGIGWIVAFDHGGYLLRRRYGARMLASVATLERRRGHTARLCKPLRALAGDAGLTAAAYPVFTVVNAVSALVLGAASVGSGYSAHSCGAPPRASRRGSAWVSWGRWSQ